MVEGMVNTEEDVGVAYTVPPRGEVKQTWRGNTTTETKNAGGGGGGWSGLCGARGERKDPDDDGYVCNQRSRASNSAEVLEGPLGPTASNNGQDHYGGRTHTERRRGMLEGSQSGGQRIQAPGDRGATEVRPRL